MVNSFLVFQNRKRVILVWFSWFGLVSFFTQGKKIEGLSVLLLGRLAEGQEMDCLCCEGSDESALK